MSSLSYKSSQPDRWIMPRPHRDASLRYMIHGPIQPMEQPGFSLRESFASLTRLFRRR